MQYAALEPDTLSQLGVPAPSFNGSSASFFATSSFLYSFFFTVIVITAFFRYVVASLLRMQASEHSIRQSNDIFKKVTLGLLGVFSLFLILVTVNKSLVRGDIGFDALKSTSDGVRGGAAAPSPAAGAPSGNSAIMNAINDDPSTRAKLQQLRISVNKPVCTSPTETGCTIVGGMNRDTLSMLQSLRTSCSVGVLEITGGTEVAGHISHGPGLPPVDISITKGPEVASCIKGFQVSRRVPLRRNNTPLCYPGEVFENFGFVFCNEQGGDPHWHIFK